MRDREESGREDDSDERTVERTGPTLVTVVPTVLFTHLTRSLSSSVVGLVHYVHHPSPSSERSDPEAFGRREWSE